MPNEGFRLRLDGGDAKAVAGLLFWDSGVTYCGNGCAIARVGTSLPSKT